MKYYSLKQAKEETDSITAIFRTKKRSYSEQLTQKWRLKKEKLFRRQEDIK